MSKLVFVCISLLLGLSIPDSSRGQPGHHPHTGPKAGRFIEKHAERLGLDAATRQTIRQIVEEARDTGQTIRASLGRVRAEMRDLLEQDHPDETTVMGQAEKIGALQLEARKNRLRAMLRIRALLSPEQRQTLTALREQKRHRRRFGACRADIAELCPQAGPGQASVRCLARYWSALSAGCQAVFERGRHRDRHGPGSRE